jgi:hypothetical protein
VKREEEGQSVQVAGFKLDDFLFKLVTVLIMLCFCLSLPIEKRGCPCRGDDGEGEKS